MRDVEDIYELLPMQQGMLFDGVAAGDSGMYLVQLDHELRGALDVAALETAWRATIARHPILRASFHWEDLEKPVLVVRREAELGLERGDWSGATPADRERLAADFLAADRRRGFALDQPPLSRLALFRTGPDRHRLVWSFHHGLLEGWSAALVLDEVRARYRAARRGERPVLAEHRPHRDYVAWLKAQDPAPAEAFWRAALRDFRRPTRLGLDRRPTGVHEPVVAWGERRAELTATETEALRALARRCGVTLNTVVQGAWAILLSRTSGDRDVVFGALVSGRSVPLDGAATIVGLCTNLVPVRVAIDEGAEPAAWLRALQERQGRQHAFEHCGLDEIRGWSDVPGGLPLFETILAFENWSGDLDAGSWDEDLEVVSVEGHQGTPGLPLMAIVVPGETLGIRLLHDVARFDRDAVARLAASLRELLAALAAGAAPRLGDLPFPSAAERALLAGFASTTAADEPQPAWIHEQVAARAAQRPDAPAIRRGAEALTYGELARSVEELARALGARGVGPGARVGVCVGRSPRMAVALLATLESGAAYVPLDPAYPPARLRFMCAHAGVEFVLAERATLAALPDFRESALVIDEPLPEIDQAQAGARTRPAADDLAYVIYTSGSTGRPKGVAVTHAGLANSIGQMRTAPGFGADDMLLAVSSLSFDIAGLDLYLPLTTGARVEIAGRGEAADGERLAARIAASGATVLQATPATWRLLLQAGWSGSERLRCLCGGEALTPDLARALLPRCRELWNLYGPTETTIWSTVGRVESPRPEDPENGEPIHVGRPIGNARVHVLDAELRPTPIGVPGEVWIGGAGVARGYDGEPALTAERFRPDPFAGAADEARGARMCATGDLGQMRADGTLELLGRLDHQVKVRGFRIEPGEIEAALARHPQVAQAVVAARLEESGEGPGEPEKQLVAWVVVPQDRWPGEAELRAFLGRELPEYMLPAVFVRLDALPRSPNGKVDRAALPEPHAWRRAPDRSFVEPRTAVERRIAAIWSQVLGVDRVGVRDNFFDLSGHSLLVMRVVGELQRQLGVKLSPGELVQPTLGQVAALCEQRLADARGSDSSRAEVNGPTAVARPLPDAARLEPLHFGDGLFGCLHLPRGDVRERGVVICPPHGHELLQLHRALQRLAGLICERGFAVLRFDLAGCGDSVGGPERWSLQRWRADLRQAVDELRARAGVERCNLVGVRLGGALAMLADAGVPEVDALALWDPVIRGSDHVRELRALHRHMEGYAHVLPAEAAGARNGSEEILGFPFPAAFAAELEALDARALAAAPARRVLLVESHPEVSQEPLRERIAELGGKVELRRFANPHLWAWVEDFGKVHVPRDLLEALAAWLDGEAPAVAADQIASTARS